MTYVILEVPCEECKGNGKVMGRIVTNHQLVTCSDCDGTGNAQQPISLSELKKILE